MREIEFRTFCKSLNKMLSFEHWKEATKGMVDVANEEMKKRGLKYNKLAPYGLFLPLEDDDLIFMQYTGLKDKNGTKIFEGDILQEYWWDKLKDDLIICSFAKVSFSFNCIRHIKFETCPHLNYFRKERFNTKRLKNCVVVGNIYDNPELLER